MKTNREQIKQLKTELRDLRKQGTDVDQEIQEKESEINRLQTNILLTT